MINTTAQVRKMENHKKKHWKSNDSEGICIYSDAFKVRFIKIIFLFKTVLVPSIWIWVVFTARLYRVSQKKHSKDLTLILYLLRFFFGNTLYFIIIWYFLIFCCQDMCWEASHQLKLKDEIESKNKLLRPLKKKSLGRTQIWWLMWRLLFIIINNNKNNWTTQLSWDL